MTPFEQVNQLILEFKDCPVTEIQKYFTPITEHFAFLNNEEKIRITQDLYKWTIENAVPIKLAYAKYLIGLAHFFRGEHEQVLPVVNEAHHIFLEQGDKDAAALCLILFGNVYRTWGDASLALKTLWEAREQLKKSGAFEYNLLACDFQIANVYLEMKQATEAVPLFTSIYEATEKSGNNIWKRNAADGLGKAYTQLKNYEAAKKYLEAGLAIGEKELHNSIFISTSLTDLGDFYFETGDDAQAEHFHNRALSLRLEHKYTSGAITNYIKLGEIYSRQSKTDEALAMLKQALDMAEQLKLNPKIYAIHALLSAIYERKQEFDKSLYHYKLFHKLRTEVKADDAAQAIKNVKMVFEAEQTMKENIIIKKQKEEIEKKNIELQETIDELTRTKVGKKAKAYTLAIAIVLFIVEEFILHTVAHLLPEDNFYLSFAVKMIIIFSLKPIDSAIEHHLLKRIIRKKPKSVVV